MATTPSAVGKRSNMVLVTVIETTGRFQRTVDAADLQPPVLQRPEPGGPVSVLRLAGAGELVVEESVRDVIARHNASGTPARWIEVRAIVNGTATPMGIDPRAVVQETGIREIVDSNDGAMAAFDVAVDGRVQTIRSDQDVSTLMLICRSVEGV